MTDTHVEGPAAQRHHVGKMIVSMLMYLILAKGGTMLVLEFVYCTVAVWDGPVLQLFVRQLLESLQSPYSRRCAWAISRLLACDETLAVVKVSLDVCESVRRFCG